MDDSAQAHVPLVLTLKRRLSAPIERVFEAWTDADLLASWFAPPGYAVMSAEIDLKVGGKYQIVIQPPDGVAVKHLGQYVEITPPTRLVFTWLLDGQVCNGNAFTRADTLVSIDFERVGDATEIVLCHERLPDKKAYEAHASGWTACLDAFDMFLRTAPS